MLQRILFLCLLVLHAYSLQLCMRKASYSPYSKPKAPIQKKSNYSPFQKQSMSKSSSVSLQSSSSSAPVISGIEIKADAALLFDCVCFARPYL